MSRAKRREMVDRRRQQLSLVRQCALLGISRSSLYYRPKGTSGEDLSLMGRIDRQYLSTPFYGSRRVSVWLRRENLHVNRERVQRLMRKTGLKAIYRRPRTSQKAPGHRVYPYLLGQSEITRSNQAWASDITYVPMARWASSTWWLSWTGIAGMWRRGASPTPWAPTSASKPWQRQCVRENRRCSTPIREASSPARSSPRSFWTTG